MFVDNTAHWHGLYVSVESVLESLGLWNVAMKLSRRRGVSFPYEDFGNGFRKTESGTNAGIGNPVDARRP
jgi:hypothetical protein